MTLAAVPTPAPPRTKGDTEKRTRHAPMYKVLLHNDDVTPFDFVEVDVCMGIFRLNAQDANRVTQEVHHRGIGLVGIYALEQAEWKCEQVKSLARGRGYPLQVSYEPA
jgi:ATP-dependent Clp protease adaptor protein ClpS